MSTVTGRVDAAVETVFEVLLDPYTYPNWLVGAHEVRHVDAAWPRPGSRFHHSVGLGGPARLKDSTKLLAVVPPVRLVLEVRARPFGRGRASFVLRELNGGQTEIVFDERPLGALAVAEPLLAATTRRRNRRSLLRLAELVDGAGVS